MKSPDVREFEQNIVTLQCNSEMWKKIKQFSEVTDNYGVAARCSFNDEDITYEVILNTDTFTIMAYYVDGYLTIDTELAEFYIDEFISKKPISILNYYREMIQYMRHVTLKV